MHSVQQRFNRPLVAILCVVACAATASVSLWPRAGSARTEDRNGDRHPDVWRMYDRQGNLSKVAIDTNFDGRADVYEYYKDGALVSRESDRNFNDQVDLVEEFDSATHERLRSVEDVDYDGTADLLVLFHDGQAVFSKWARRATVAVAAGSSTQNLHVAPRTADDPLTPFEDPFGADLAVRGVLVACSGDDVALSTSEGLPASGREIGSRLTSSSALEPAGRRYVPSAILDAHSSRGPPVSHS
jgi:hypothetical protein